MRAGSATRRERDALGREVQKTANPPREVASDVKIR